MTYSSSLANEIIHNLKLLPTDFQILLDKKSQSDILVK